MKKNMLILGCEEFEDMNYESGCYGLKNNKIIGKMKNEYDIDNCSCQNLNSNKALKFAEAFVKERKYCSCIIALGQAEDNIETFKSNLFKIIDVLKNSKIKPILIGLSKKHFNSNYEEVISSVSLISKVEYISDNVEAKCALVAKSEFQMRKAITTICS